VSETPPPFGDEAGLAGLVARLWADISALVRAEIALTRAEVRQAIRGIAFGIAALGLALVLVLVALISLTGAAVAGLVAAGLHPAIAGVIVALGAVALAALCVWWALSRFRQAAGLPARTAHNLRRDVETLATMVKRHA